MAEYLSPGVYIEEFEAGSRPITGVSTSTVGFLGVTQRGPKTGVPSLVTSYADYTRKFGGYLSEKIFKDFRFMPYAVEQFFQNGGSRCFVMRVCHNDAAEASRTWTKQSLQVQESQPDSENTNLDNGDSALMTLKAKNEGSWGNGISMVFTVTDSTTAVIPADKTADDATAVIPADKTADDATAVIPVDKTADDANGTETAIQVRNAAAFNQGDIIALMTPKQTSQNEVQYNSIYNTVIRTDDTSIYLEGKDLDKVKLVSIPRLKLEIKFDNIIEVYEDISFNPNSPYFITTINEKSELICIDSINSKEIQEQILKDNHLLKWMSGLTKSTYMATLERGTDGTENVFSDQKNMVEAFKGTDTIPGKKTGLAAFVDNDIVSLMCVPGITNESIQQAVINHCELLSSRFAILDIPKDLKASEKLVMFRENIDSSYVAIYHPWIQIYDIADKKQAMFPPSGAVAGVYSRSDQERGVHKAPANEVLRGVTGLDCIYGSREQEILNPKGINIIRPIQGLGIRVWGARTCSSNGLWKYVNVRRLFIFLEESIKASTNWVVFEPNDELLWIRVKRTIEVFLNSVWRSGALFGSSPEEAFYINIGRTTMTQDDIDNGRLICIIGAAPVKPAEFVIFRLTQKTMND